MLDLDSVVNKMIHIMPLKNYLSLPKKYVNSSGYDLFGYPREEFVKAAVHLANSMENMSYDEAAEYASEIAITMNINLYAIEFFSALFRNCKNSTKSNPYDIIMDIYSRYCEIEIDELKKMQTSTNNNFYQDKWEEIVSDEDNVTPEQLDTFYNSLPVWSTSSGLEMSCKKSDLASAFYAIPLILVKNQNRKNVFDFGGNDGMLTSAISKYATERTTLIESNEALLDIAKFRDNALGIDNVEYLPVSELTANLNKYEGIYDFGICTEILEHVYDVEETVRILSALLKKGGLLFLSTSFNVYPYASHLKKNVKYYGGLDTKVYNNFGLADVKINGLAIPLFGNMRFLMKE